MPELPEVETARRRIEEALHGKMIRTVHTDTEDRFLFAFTPVDRFREALEGARVRGSGRRGKYFWLELDRKPWPIFHLGMTGNVDIRLPKRGGGHVKAWGGLRLWSSPGKGDPGPLWFCRLRIETGDGTQVAITDPRRFGRVWLADDPLSHPRIKKLGYDPLHEFPTQKELAAILKKRKAAIKAVLLDQKIFAGVGNWIADEALYQAKLNPHLRGSELKPAQVKSLRAKLLEVVKRAVRAGSDYEKFPSNWLFHHRWGKVEGSETARKQKIIHETIGGRTTAWVPSVQKK